MMDYHIRYSNWTNNVANLINLRTFSKSHCILKVALFSPVIYVLIFLYFTKIKDA